MFEESRSVQRRKAVQRGEPTPTFLRDPEPPLTRAVTAETLAKHNTLGDNGHDAGPWNECHVCRASLPVGDDTPSLDAAREDVIVAAENVDGCWHDEGDHVEFHGDLAEALIALRKTFTPLDRALNR